MKSSDKTAQFFISYAREDKAFAIKLRRGLAARGRLAWLDLKNIGALAPWRKEIANAIDAADVFVFILSPDSVASRACRSELRFAVDAKKRLAPLVWRETDDKAVPPVLRIPNWLFTRRGESIEDLVERLIKAADRDSDWIRDHSRLLMRAREWMQHHRDSSRLLSGQGLQDALRWLAQSGGAGDRGVSRLHAEFVEASRVAEEAANAHRRELYLKALARQLAAQSELTRGSQEYPIETPALLAIESLRRWPTVEGDRAFRRSIRLVPRPPLIRHVYPNDALVLMSREGRAIAVGVRKVLRLVDASNGATAWRVRLGVNAERIDFGAGELVIIVRGTGGIVEVRARYDGALLGRCRMVKEPDMLVVHPDGKMIAAANSLHPGSLEVWELGRDTPLFNVELQDKPAAIGVFGNSLVAIAGPDSPMGHTRVLVWTIGEPEPREFWTLYGRPLHAAIAYDGAWVAVTTIAFGSGRPNNISVGALARRLADPEAGEKMHELPHDEAVEYFAAEGFDRLVSFTRGGTNIHVWEPAVLRLIGRYRVQDQAYRASLAEEGQFLVVAHRDAKDLRSGGQVSLVTSDGETKFTTRSKDMVNELSCDSGGCISIANTRQVTRWDSDTSSVLQQLRAEEFTRLVFSADSSHLLVKAPHGEGSLIIPADRVKPALQLGQTGSLWTQEFAGDGAHQIVTVGNPVIGTSPRGDPHVRLWDVTRGKLLAFRHRIELAPIALTRDGRIMATTESGGSVTVRRIADGRVRQRIKTESPVSELLFDDGGRNLAALTNAHIEVWCMADGKRTSMTAFDGPATLSAFDVDHDSALIGSSVVRLSNGQRIFENDGRAHVNFARGLIARIDQEKNIEVYRLNRSDRPIMKAFHEGAVHVELAPHGENLLSAGVDGSARIWHIADGAERARLEHPNRVLDGHFSPDSRLIATVCSDNIVRMWTWRAEDLITEGQSRIGRGLSREELDSFLPDPETRRV
jgi:WD40 repeat protein